MDKLWIRKFSRIGGISKMSFSTMLDCLKEQEKGKIVFVKLGTFYIAVGEDAVLLHNKLELKCTCYKNHMCKVGFPVNALDKYIEKLNEKTQIFKNTQGINFCGYKINENRLKIRDKRKKKTKEEGKRIKVQDKEGRTR